jgi:hypothetical protein
MVAGDLKKPITANKIPIFLENLFPSFPYRISRFNVYETLEIFGRTGVRAKQIAWADIRKALRENRGIQSRRYQAIFFNTALNPDSWLLKLWNHFLMLVALYHFIVVPIRVSFLPWASMTDSRALATDLIADIFTWINVLVKGNTAHRSSRAVWITERYKLFRKIDIYHVSAALPLDW